MSPFYLLLFTKSHLCSDAFKNDIYINATGKCFKTTYSAFKVNI